MIEERDFDKKNYLNIFQFPQFVVVSGQKK